MATKTLLIDHTASANVYFRVFNTSGNVLDFDDNTFKAIGSATTPQLVATERTSMNGTGFSGYTASLDLSLLNSALAPAEFIVRAYDNGTPAATDVAISDPLGLTVQLSEEGDEPVYVESEVSVLSTAGDEAHVSLWLVCRGKLVSISGATCSVTIKEMGGGSVQFTLTEADKAGANAIVDNRFELTKSTPNFTDDRQYAISASITLSGVTYTSPESAVVIG